MSNEARMPGKSTALSMADTAAALGRSEEFVLSLALSGARQPTEQGGGVVEIDYAMAGNDLVFTRPGVDKFLRRCPLPEMVTAAEAATRLGIHRSQVTVLVYTGVPLEDGRVFRLPIWTIGGAEYVVKSELEGFAIHHTASNERRAAREFAKRYQNRGRKADASPTPG